MPQKLPRLAHCLHSRVRLLLRTQFPAQTFSRKQNIQIQLFETINNGSRNPIIKAMRVRHNAITIQSCGKHRGVSRSRKACTPANSSTSLRFAPCQTWMRATTSKHWGNHQKSRFHINNSPRTQGPGYVRGEMQEEQCQDHRPRPE